MTKDQKTVKQMSIERGTYMRKPEKITEPSKQIKQLASTLKKDNQYGCLF